MEYEYIWGGSGEDILYGGYDNDNEYINGNDGDDIIYPASGTVVTDRVRAGKGDDQINPVVLEFDGAGAITTDLTSRVNQSTYGTAPTNWQGGEGNDTIWGKFMPGADQVYEGGNGDDTIYGAYGQTAGEQKIVGGGGEDFISTEFYEGADVADLQDLTIWGDWDYGTGADFDQTI